MDETLKVRRGDYGRYFSRSKKKGNMRKKSTTNKYDAIKVKDPSRLPQKGRAFDQISKNAESKLQCYGEKWCSCLHDC